MNTAEILQAKDNKIHFLESKLIDQQNELDNYKKRCDQYMQAYDSLQHQVKELLRNRFGKKSERFIDPEHPQMSLFDSNEKFVSAEAAGDLITEEEITVASHKRKKKTKGNKELPRRIEIIPLSDADKICSCGACKKIINHEVKEMIDYQPAVFEIVEQRREVGVCPKGCDGSIITAASPLHILPKTKATEAFLSFLVVSKLEDRQPLYHLEKQLSARFGVDCSRQAMANWVIGMMEPLQPIFNLMKDEVIDYDIASADATTLQVLNLA